MIRKRLPRCRKCGSFFMLRAAEMQLFENLGSNVRPSVCSYCRQLEIDRLYEEARTDPAKRVECQCSICRRSFVLPIIPRRSDHFRIRLSGRGAWKLWSLVRESYIGSDL